MHRAGTRYNRRGCDSEGHCANFVETEQSICSSARSVVLTMLRGSVPLQWYQRPTIKSWRPQIEFNTKCNQEETARRHVGSMVSSYGQSVLVDLLSTGSFEGRLSNIYCNAIAATDHPEENHVAGSIRSVLGVSCRYVGFDVNKFCGRKKYDGLSRLYSAISPDLIYNGFSILRNNVWDRQKGVLRVNCLDSLDRYIVLFLVTLIL